MNLTKIRKAKEKLEQEAKEKEANREWKKAKEELGIRDLDEACCLSRMIS